MHHVGIGAAHAANASLRSPTTTTSPFTGTLYMQQVLGYSALQGGLAWATSGIASMLFAGISQTLVTTISAKAVMAFGMSALAAGIFWTTQAPEHGHFLPNLFGPFLVGVEMGTAFTFIPIQIAALAGASPNRGRPRIWADLHLPGARRRARAPGSGVVEPSGTACDHVPATPRTC